MLTYQEMRDKFFKAREEKFKFEQEEPARKKAELIKKFEEAVEAAEKKMRKEDTPFVSLALENHDMALLRIILKDHRWPDQVLNIVAHDSDPTKSVLNISTRA